MKVTLTKMKCFETKDTDGTSFWGKIKEGIENGEKSVFGEGGVKGFIQDILNGDIKSNKDYGLIGGIKDFFDGLAEDTVEISRGDTSRLKKWGVIGEWAQGLVDASDMAEGALEKLIGLEPGIAINNWFAEGVNDGRWRLEDWDLSSIISGGFNGATPIAAGNNISNTLNDKFDSLDIGEKLARESMIAGLTAGEAAGKGFAAGIDMIDWKKIPINKEKGVTTAKSFLQGYQPTFVKGMDKVLGSPVNTKKYKHTGTTISREMALGILEGKGDINMAISEALQPKRKGGSGDYRELGKSVADSISAGIASGKSNLSSKLKKLVTDSTSGGKSAAKSKDVKDIGKYIVEGIIAGASDKKKDLEKAMKKLAKLAEAGFAAGAIIGSPSKLMAKDGEFLVQGLNMGIENEAHTTADVMDNWLSSISDSVSIDVSNISMPNVADIVDEVQGYIATTGSMSIKSDTETMQRFYTDNIIPILSDIANDAKRQADKEEKTEVVLDNRKVTSAVNRQNRVNGYSFT